MDKTTGYVLAFFYTRINHGEQARMTYAIDSTRADMIILGSSRASHHYVPHYFSDSLGMTCYNAGKDKQGILYSLAVLKTILHRYQPHEILLDVTPQTFNKGEVRSNFDVLSVLLPYYKKHPEIQNIVDQRSPWEFVKTYSSLYCYNSLPLQIIFNNLSNGRDAGAEDGYVPQYNIWKKPLEKPKYLSKETNTTDSLSIAAFGELIQLCKTNGCKLVIIISPIYQLLPAATPSVTILKNICIKNNQTILDYSKSPLFLNNPMLFSDMLHLNNSGAALFSAMLCSDLKGLTATK